jgi:hypothetical protein
MIDYYGPPRGAFPLCRDFGSSTVLILRHEFLDLIVIQIIMRPPPWPFVVPPSAFSSACSVAARCVNARAAREEVWAVGGNITLHQLHPWTGAQLRPTHEPGRGRPVE